MGRDGKVYIELCVILVDWFRRVRQGIPFDKQQRQEGVRNKGDSHKQI